MLPTRALCAGGRFPHCSGARRRSSGVASSRPTLFFDMNETSLDMRPTFAAVDKVAGPGAHVAWFDRMIQMSMVHSHTGQYDGFGVLAASAFKAVCESKGVPACDAGWESVKAQMSVMEGYSDVSPGLDALAANGFQLVAFSNSTLATLSSQLELAGLYDKYDAIVSVDGPSCYKPARKTYEYALAQLSVSPRDAVMVACHDWDLAGAAALGMKTAFIERENCNFASAYSPPDFTASDFLHLAEMLGQAK